MIISSIDGLDMPGLERILEQLRLMYGGENVYVTEPAIGARFSILIRPIGDSPFNLALLSNGTLTTDATRVQQASVAAMVRTLLPVDSGRIVAIDFNDYAYVDLVSDITPEDILRGWRSVDDGDFE